MEWEISLRTFHKENRNKLYVICRFIGQQYLPSRGETRIRMSEMYLPLYSNHPFVPPLHSTMLNKYHSTLRIYLKYLPKVSECYMPGTTLSFTFIISCHLCKDRTYEVLHIILMLQMRKWRAQTLSWSRSHNSEVTELKLNSWYFWLQSPCSLLFGSSAREHL